MHLLLTSFLSAAYLQLAFLTIAYRYVLFDYLSVCLMLICRHSKFPLPVPLAGSWPACLNVLC